MLRLIGGLAIGGLLAPAWSINIEVDARRQEGARGDDHHARLQLRRRDWPGQVTNWLAPQYGWEGVFFFCGAATLRAGASCCCSRCPNRPAGWSPRASRRPRSCRLLSRFDPRVDAGRLHRLRAVRRAQDLEPTRYSPVGQVRRELFRGTLAFITPLIWVTYFFSSFAIYLKASFGVLFMEELGHRAHDGRQHRLDRRPDRRDRRRAAAVVHREARAGAGSRIAPLLGVPLALWIGSGILLDGAAVHPGDPARRDHDRHRPRGGDLDHQHLLSERGPLDRRRLGQLHGQVRRGRRADPRRLLFPRQRGRRCSNGYLFTALCLAGVVLGAAGAGGLRRRLKAEQAASRRRAPARCRRSLTWPLRSLAANTPSRRANWKALGLTPEDMLKPKIAVVN